MRGTELPGCPSLTRSPFLLLQPLRRRVAGGGQPSFSPVQRPSPSRCRFGGAGVSAEGGRVGMSLKSSHRLFMPGVPVQLPSTAVTDPLSAH